MWICSFALVKCEVLSDFLLVTLSLMTTAMASGKYTGSCSDGAVGFARRPLVGLAPGYMPAAEVIQVHESPPSECFTSCVNQPRCYGYIWNYNNSCSMILGGFLKEHHLIPAKSSSYHWKICLTGRRNKVNEELCSRHEWAFDVVPNMQLSRYDDKSLLGITNIEHCMDECASETTFVCRSSSYKPKAGECILSRHDRRTATEIFRKNTDTEASVYYIERQCIQEPSGCQFRTRAPESSLFLHRQHVQIIANVSSREECEESCLRWGFFPCRAYQFVASEPEAQAVCLISPDDTSIMQTDLRPLMSTAANNTAIFEKESCVESSVRCGASSMSVIVRVTTPFRGRVYALGHPYDCYSVTVASNGQVTLDLPLHGRRCGIKNLGNGTFLNSVVVQHHPSVLRNSDRRIDVTCDYHELSTKIKGTKGVQHTHLDEGDSKPISQHTVTAVAHTPPIRLRVVNSSDQDVAGAELGDPLFLKVELADDSVYGIFGSYLVARSSAGSETVLLIDDNGCPVEPSVISSLKRLPDSKSLVAPFQAFKFASDSSVKFQLTVSYCLDACPPVNCESSTDTPNRHRSYGRRKRRSAVQPFLDLMPGDVVLDVQAETTFFHVNNIGSSWETNRTHRLLQPQFFQENPQKQVWPHLASKTVCMNLETVYLSIIVAGTVQFAIVCVCVWLYVVSGKGGLCLSRFVSSKSLKKYLHNRT